jgi:hypothetical protein
MADSSDVEAALAAYIATIVVPNGPASPPIAGIAVTVGRGYPGSTRLDAAVSEGRSWVTVVESPGFYRETTGFINYRVVIPPPPATLDMSVSGSSVLLSGAAYPGAIVGIRIGREPFSYLCGPSDSLFSVACALTQAIAGSALTDDSGNKLTDDSGNVMVTGIQAVVLDGTTPLTQADGTPIAEPASPSDPLTISLGTSLAVTVQTGGTGQIVTGTRWQEAAFNVTIWAPDPTTRDILAKAIDGALSAVNWVYFPEGTAGQIRFRGNKSTDQSERARVWVRTLVLSILYPTVTVTPAATMVWPVSDITSLT